MPIGSGRTTPLNKNDRIDFERDVFNIFVEPSIQDWAAARLLFQANLFRQFAWSCAQALEKSIKAALLLNWESAKFGHDFSAKFSKLNELSSGLMPSNFPEDYPSFEWMVEHFQNTENCSETISRFERNGSTESRYASTDLLIRPDDLFRLDFLMKHILRHCRELDEMSVDWLKKNPNEIHAFLAYAVNRLSESPLPTSTRNAFKINNFSLLDCSVSTDFNTAFSMSVSRSDRTIYSNTAAQRYLEKHSKVVFKTYPRYEPKD